MNARAVAYRLLGSIGEAEDAVQEAHARWYALPEARRREVRSRDAWLVTTVSRICLDILGSARVRREHYVGEWLPEPVGTSEDPADLAELDESLSMALLVVLERMTPAERVAFVLHDVFGFRYAEIAEIVGRTEHACRQLASSGRRRADEARGRAVDPAVVAALKRAWEARDLDALVRQLDPAVIAFVDGGGHVSAARDPIAGVVPVARLLLSVLDRQPGLTLHIATVNGASGLIARAPDATVLAVTSVTTTDGRVDRLWSMRNPDKLTTWT
ncbi:sigma-70 family RNA polymerase sigma factor [Solirubrobacter sp. CPCC 204708]|uniref:Sigma-70 family RNA polymerase sigma factor n=1 Tax=Solirubrobacter deserti TaxID=2282478 RepID=A0ABT4RJZ3_9ACTN|nr:sigma-70 family RNA polymerase sigma factor [Solirubrobacter deserti]MBE2315782.1 sigma-70 family RNA polymerase sigma factor [Solirubrobacter deserti]MDA0138881.1 sigma-70 family RNA polymerase sigma factor [Solirubrobacter deserti]